MKYLKTFQRNNNLVPDGIIGIKTLRKFKEVFHLKNNEQTAHFIGQLAHESANFSRGEESFNYSEKRLLKVFKNHFTKKTAKQYVGYPVCIANKVYANRMKNGNEQSGEGYLFRGRGALMLTGKQNYQLFSQFICEDVTLKPSLVKTNYYFESALWYFNHNNLWRYCNHINQRDITQLTKLINGGYNGLDHRYNLTNHYYKILSN